MKSSFRKASLELVQKQVKEGGGWIVILCNSNQAQDLITAGGAFQELSLKGIPEKIGFHPMSQVLEEEYYRNELMTELKCSKPI